MTTTAAGNLFRGGRAEYMRAELVRTELLDAVIQLPPGLSHVSSIAMVLLLFQRGRPGRNGRVAV